MKHVWVKERARSNSGPPGKQSFNSINCHISWDHSVAPGRVLFEIGGVPIREELARQGMFVSSIPQFPDVTPPPSKALRLASAKLPVMTEFIDRSAPPRLGSLLITPEVAEESKLPYATLRKLS